jgi:hypothetical protein
MNTEQLVFNTNCYSVTTEETPRVIYQKSQEIHKHRVAKGYQILSKNDFNKVKRRVNLGIFNHKTNFIVGEEPSLLVWDNQKGIISSPKTSEIIEEPNRYFLIYDLNFILDDQNEKISIYDKETNQTLKLVLNKQFGQDIGHFMAYADPNSDSIPDDFQIIKAIIQLENGRMSLNKQVLINSNFEFLLGVLEGYIGGDTQFILNSNINLYNITYILNLLGAQYSLRSIEDNKKHVRFKLPAFLKDVSNLRDNFFRIYKYKFQNKKLSLIKDAELDIIDPQADFDFFDLVNSGAIEMIPAKDLVFLEIDNKEMFDLTMGDPSATNYALPMTPTLKNSDGDVLGAIAIMTKDGSEECQRKFSTEFKQNFLNLNDASVQNWGVKLNSQLGLYSATK